VVLGNQQPTRSDSYYRSSVSHTLFKDFFPYQDTSLTAIEENLRLSGKDPDRANEESYEEVLTDIKKYLFSEANNIFEGNAQAKRHETLIDDESNTSLSTYIKDTLEVQQIQERYKFIKEKCIN
jgi:hypothetical protein